MPFNRKDHHLSGEIRPRFKLSTTYSVDEVFEHLERSNKDDKTIIGRKVLNQFYVDIPSWERHFWSPELRVTPEVDEEDETKTIVRVMVGPQYTVWVLFVFLYSFFGLVSLFGGMYGLSQLSLGASSPWIWCFPVTALILFLVFLIAKAGQKRGRDETLHLVSFVYHSLQDGNIERIES